MLIFTLDAFTKLLVSQQICLLSFLLFQEWQDGLLTGQNFYKIKKIILQDLSKIIKVIDKETLYQWTKDKKKNSISSHLSQKRCLLNNENIY